MPLNAIMTPEPISLYRSRVFRALFYTRYTIYYTGFARSMFPTDGDISGETRAPYTIYYIYTTTHLTDNRIYDILYTWRLKKTV